MQLKFFILIGYFVLFFNLNPVILNRLGLANEDCHELFQKARGGIKDFKGRPLKDYALVLSGLSTAYIKGKCFHLPFISHTSAIASAH